MSYLNVDDYRETLSLEDKNAFDSFFKKFDEHCLIDFDDKERIKDDFFKAIQFYVNNCISQEEALKLLDTKYLGNFYINMSKQRFQLDDIAKLFSLSTSYDFTAMFRLSVYLKKEVVPELLQMALNFTIKRFPIFATTFKKGIFWHYLEVTNKRFCVEVENDIPCQPIDFSKNDSSLFRVLYFKNRISVEIFHILTDGTGGTIFLKALLTEYLRLTGVEVSIDETIVDINSNVEQEEFENVFDRIPLTKKASGVLNKRAVQVKGKLSQNRPCRIIHFKLDATKLSLIAQKYNTTVTGYLLSLMFIAGKAAMNKLCGDSSIMVPVNIRKFYPTKTIRNFSSYCGIRLSNKELNDFSVIVQNVNEQLSNKTSKVFMSEMITQQKLIVKLLNYIPLFLKRTFSKIGYNFILSNMFTNYLSNLGVIELPKSISVNVESMDFILSSAMISRLACGVITINNTTTFSITKLTNDSTFEEKLYDLFCNDGIISTVEGSALYED